MVGGLTDEEEQERLVVAMPHAVAYPGAVVVHPALQEMFTHPTYLKRPCYNSPEAFLRAYQSSSPCQQDATQPMEDIPDECDMFSAFHT